MDGGITVMVIDGQVIFNVLIVVLGGFGGWILNVIWRSIRDLQIADKQLVDNLAAIKILVAGDYVPRPEIDSNLRAIFQELNIIKNMLHEKQDRPKGP